MLGDEYEWIASQDVRQGVFDLRVAEMLQFLAQDQGISLPQIVLANVGAYEGHALSGRETLGPVGHGPGDFDIRHMVTHARDGSPHSKITAAQTSDRDHSMSAELSVDKRTPFHEMLYASPNDSYCR